MSWNMTTPYSRHRRSNAYQVTKATVHVVPASVSHTLPLVIPGCSLLQDSSLIELNQKAPLMSVLLKQTEGSLKYLRVRLRKEKHEVWHPSYKMDLRMRKSTFWHLVVICYDWNSLHRTYNFTLNIESVFQAAKTSSRKVKQDISLSFPPFQGWKLQKGWEVQMWKLASHAPWVDILGVQGDLCRQPLYAHPRAAQ